MREYIKNPIVKERQRISKRISTLMHMEENLFYKRLINEISLEQRDANKKRSLNYYNTSKEELYKILGGAICVKCGFDDKRALQFDHIYGDGLNERRDRRRTYLRKYVVNPELAKQKLQVLCANCNWIKRHENSEHGFRTTMKLNRRKIKKN